MPITVSLVEDEPIFQDALRHAVTDAHDMRLVGVASDLAGGMAQLDKGPVDILLVDLGLPDGSGLELIREAVRRWPNRCDVMVISMFGDPAQVMAALEAGATGYLLKDSKPINIAQHIRELHAGESPISSRIARHLLTRLAPLPMAGTKNPANTGLSLTEKERTVLTLAAKGYSYVQVAKLMSVSPETVKTHVKNCYRKLHVKSKVEAIYEARQLGMDLD